MNFIIFLVVVVFLLFCLYKIIKPRKEDVNNFTDGKSDEVKELKQNKKSIFLRENEMDFFNSLPRKERRKQVLHFENQIKKGNIVAVINKEDKLIGFIKRIEALNLVSQEKGIIKDGRYYEK